MIPNDGQAATGALVRADHPWSDPALACLYDLFPFDADLPLYLELAGAQGGRVLELACGSGRVLVPLAQAGHRVVGVDDSPHMLAVAREKLQAAGPSVAARAEVVEGDMRAFAVDGLFDLAIIPVKSFVYLTTREDQQRALTTVANHLRPGGLLVLDLLNPSPAWLSQPDGSLRQDLAQHLPDQGVTVTRTEAVVHTDLATQVRVIRSTYQIIAPDGTVTTRIVEWPFRYTYRYEAEHLLERTGFAIEAVYGGYQREPFTSTSPVLLLIGRRVAN